MKTARQINSDQCGAVEIFESMCAAMGVKLVTVKATKPKRKRAKKK